MSTDGNPFGTPTPAATSAANPYAAPQSNVGAASGFGGGGGPAPEVQSLKDIWLKWDGRIPRKAYWQFFMLPLFAVAFGLGILSAVLGMGEALIWIFQIAVIYPSIAAGRKRLHDRDMSGWFLLLGIVPLANIALLVIFCLRGTEGPNRFGGDATGMY